MNRDSFGGVSATSAAAAAGLPAVAGSGVARVPGGALPRPVAVVVPEPAQPSRGEKPQRIVETDDVLEYSKIVHKLDALLVSQNQLFLRLINLNLKDQYKHRLDLGFSLFYLIHLKLLLFLSLQFLKFHHLHDLHNHFLHT